MIYFPKTVDKIEIFCYNDYIKEKENKPMLTYAERILTIAAALDAAEIPVPYTVCPCYEGWQLRFPWCKGDIAVHDGTYGANAGKVESYQFWWDGDDVTTLTVDEAIRRIKNKYILYKMFGLIEGA